MTDILGESYSRVREVLERNKESTRHVTLCEDLKGKSFERAARISQYENVLNQYVKNRNLQNVCLSNTGEDIFKTYKGIQEDKKEVGVKRRQS